jgi:hypothetical protein
MEKKECITNPFVLVFVTDKNGVYELQDITPKTGDNKLTEFKVHQYARISPFSHSGQEQCIISYSYTYNILPCKRKLKLLRANIIINWFLHSNVHFDIILPLKVL